MHPFYPEFRRRLDNILRTRDAGALRAFLVEQGEWDANTTTDPERAMWMMIATSPGLSELHDEAIAWLNAHGHSSEASLLARRERGGRSGQPGRRTPPSRGPDRGSQAPRNTGQRDHRRPRRP